MAGKTSVETAGRTEPDIEAMYEKAAAMLGRELTKEEARRVAAPEGEAKAIVDLISVISRTLEKIDAMRRMFKADRDAADRQQRDGETETIRRDQLATQIAEKIDRLVEERAERLLRERLCTMARAGGRESDPAPARSLS